MFGLDQWLLMHGTKSPEQVCKKGSCEKLARHALHVIHVTPFGSRRTSANSLSSGSSRVSIPRFARFREDSNLGSCGNFQRNHDERTVPKVHVLHQSLLSQHHPDVPQNDTNVLLFHTQRDSVRAQVPPGQISCLSDQDKKMKSEPGRRRHHDSPPRCLSLCCR